MPEPEPGSIRAEFNQYLQRRAADGPFKDLDVHAQAARFRVAASDFNQLHWHWLDRKAEDLLLGHYARITGRDLRPLYAQVRVTRLLWHLRTYNFYTLVHGEAPGAHAAHLDHAAGLLSDIAPQRVG